jgi:aspartate aminotransferase-like enzyme
VAKEFDKLILVDAISGLGSIDLPVDKWQCDVVITASQKGWMAPPGLAMVSFSQKAWEAYSQAKMPRYYFDFGKARDYLSKGQTPWTPAISTFYALSVALELIEREGLANILARHARVAQLTRNGVKEIGLELFPKEEFASNTVTAIKSPPGVDTKRLLQLLNEEYQVTLSGGQERLAGKIFRIGHLGWVTEEDIKQVLEALKDALSKNESYVG